MTGVKAISGCCLITLTCFFTSHIKCILWESGLTRARPVYEITVRIKRKLILHKISNFWYIIFDDLPFSSNAILIYAVAGVGVP